MAYIPPLNGGRINANITGNTVAAGTLISTGTMVLSGGNNITLSQNGQSIGISAANAPTASIKVSGGGSSASLSALTFSNANNVGFGLSTAAGLGTLTASAFINVSATNTSNNVTNLAFNTSNGITFGLSTAANGGTITASHNALTSQSNQALAGSNGTSTFQTATFGNSNGMNFYFTNGSMVGSYTVPTQTNQTLAFTAAGTNTTQNTTATFNATSIVVSGGGLVSAGFSNGTLQISGTQSTQSQNNIAGVIAAGSTNTSGSISFANSNGLAFGLSNNTITGSYTVPTQTVQTLSQAVTGNTFGNTSGMSVDARSLTMVGSGGVGVGISTSAGGGSSLMVSGPAVSSISATGAVSISVNANTVSIGAPVQSNQTDGFYITGNTTATAGGGSTSSNPDARFVSISAAGALSAGWSSNSMLVLSVPNNFLTTARASNDAIGLNTAGTNVTWTANSSGLSINASGYAGTGFTGTNATGTMNSNGLQLSVNAGGGGVALSNSQTMYTSGTVGILEGGGAITIASSTSAGGGQTFRVSGPVVSSLSATGAVSISNNAGTISIGAPAFSIGQTNIGNSSNTSGTVSGQMVLSGGSNITLSQSNNGASATIGIIGPPAVALYDGAASITSGTARFSSPNNVSFGIAGQNITASAFMNISNTATSVNASKLMFNSSNGITFGLSTGAGAATITASHNALTTARASTDAIGLNTAGTNVTWTANSSGLSINASGYAGTGFTGTNATGTMNSNGLQLSVGGGGGGVGLNDGAHSITSGTVSLIDGNGINWSITNQSLSAIITNQYNILNNTITTGGSSTATLNASGINISNFGAISGGFSGSTMQLSVPATSSLSATGAISMSTNGSTVSIGAPAMSSLSGAGIISLSSLGSTIIISATGGGGGGGGVNIAGGGNTVSTGTAVLSGLGAMSVISTTGSQFNIAGPGTSSMVGINGISIATAGSTISFNGANLEPQTYSTYVNMLQASTSSQTLGAMNNGAAGSVQFYPVSIPNYLAFDAVRVAFSGSFVSQTSNGSQTISHSFGLYTRNVSTLSLVSSGSMGYSVSGSSGSATVSYATSTGTGGYGYGSTSAGAIGNLQTSFGNGGGLHMVDLQFGNSLSVAPGMYWLAMNRKESSGNSNVGMSLGLAGNIMIMPNDMVPFGSASSAGTSQSAQKGPYVGFGVYTATSNGIPSSAAITNINQSLTIMPFMTFIST